MANKQTATVPPELDGERIDKALAALIPDMSRHLARKVLAMGGVHVSKRRVRMASFPVKVGDTLVAVWHPDILEPERYPMTVVFEDDDLIVVDKPSGQLSQGSELGDVGSLIYSLMRRYGPDARLMHRLDKGASGLLVAARNTVASAMLTPQFREHTIERRYLALVSGVPPEGPVTIPIVSEGRKVRAAYPGEDGMSARSEVRVLSTEGDTSLVEVTLYTGRTHQIRIHLSALGSPIVGDPEYGGRPAGRLALHAAILGLYHPDGRILQFRSNPPEDFEACRPVPVVVT
jgi:23S rRNA pseudouridine1911/1915/1917 synthase